MSRNNKAFLVDTNSIVTPYKTFYPFDFAKNFWLQLQEKIENGNIIIMDIVRDELRKGDDELTDWINEFDKLILSRDNQSIVREYSNIINYIQQESCYNSKALMSWSDASVADAWLIAASIVYGYAIVTFEKPNKNLNSDYPSKNAKIPDVARKFNVECCDIYHMMRELNITL